MTKVIFFLLGALFLVNNAFAEEVSILSKVQACRQSKAINNESEEPTLEGAGNSLRHYHFFRFQEISSLLDIANGDTEAKSLYYRWLFITEDLKGVDSLSSADLSKGEVNVPALLAKGELNYKLIKYDSASVYFDKALKQTLTSKQKSQAIVGIAKILYKQSKYQESLDTLTSLIGKETLNDDVLYNMGLALINLSRVNDAIDMFEEAIIINPYSENAHYFMGNGYARKNYTQLHEVYSKSFADSSAMNDLNRVKAYMTTGKLDSVRISMKPLFDRKNPIVEPNLLLGSMNWSQGNFEVAANDFRNALKILPEYGRAQNGLAKSLEGMRMQINIHRKEDSIAFANQPMPQIEGIEKFIINWNSLSPRHQKRVALSVEPWKIYIPLLVECGSRFYIKPLHEILSESPGLETIRDQRISYDSRLWDDVRGAGGFITVTGVEDVERCIYQNYNTVLHELTHQVHALFPSTDLKRIEDAFHATHTREDAGTKSFMSQYQASSVYEYFAEGANAYYTHKRDKYDTKEIVHERLITLDTALVRIVEDYTKGPNLKACYPVGFVNAAGNEVEKQNLTHALGLTEKAYKNAPKDEAVLSEFSYLYSLLGKDSLAIAYAETLVTLYPKKAGSYTRLESANFMKTGDRRYSIAVLQKGLEKVDSLELNDLYASLGSSSWYVGEYKTARENFLKIIAKQPQNPEALWGFGLALGDNGEFAEADSVFQRAIAVRNGIVELRLDYARILLQNNKLAEAEKQIEEAKLLTPDNDQVITFEGWLFAKKGEWRKALEKFSQAVEKGFDTNLPSILRIETYQNLGKSDMAQKEADRLLKLQTKQVPEWVYRVDKSAYVGIKGWPVFQMKLLNDISHK